MNPHLATKWQPDEIPDADAATPLQELSAVAESKDAVRLIEFLSPHECASYVPPAGAMLVGDCHIVRGSVFVIGGPPGVGKSRSSVGLAVAGATGAEWFALRVHRRFKTLIVQNENGRFRLKQEFADLDLPALEDAVRVTPPPPHGLALGDPRFCAQLKAGVAAFAPDVVIIDPWNAATADEKAGSYLAAFDALRAIIPAGDDQPALGIIAHTRKPRADERAAGRGLLNLLAGSYVLGSVPRSVFIMQAASDDTTDARIVWTCAKNNDGELGARSAWERRNGLFVPVAGFDWETFDNRADGHRKARIADEDVVEAFDGGLRSRKELAQRLADATGASRATCYRKIDALIAAGAIADAGNGLLKKSAAAA